MVHARYILPTPQSAIFIGSTNPLNFILKSVICVIFWARSANLQTYSPYPLSPKKCSQCFVQHCRYEHLVYIFVLFVFLHSIENLDVASLEYRRMHLKGRFDHSNELYVMPRSLNVEGGSTGGLGKKPKSGAHILTPFILSNSG